jgi:DNA-binding protein YbaB
MMDSEQLQQLIREAIREAKKELKKKREYWPEEFLGEEEGYIKALEWVLAILRQK